MRPPVVFALWKRCDGMIKVANVSWQTLPKLGGIEIHLDALSRYSKDTTYTIFSGNKSTKEGVYSPVIDADLPEVGDDAYAELVEELALNDVVVFHNPGYHYAQRIYRLVEMLRSAKSNIVIAFDIHGGSNPEDFPTCPPEIENFIVHCDIEEQVARNWATSKTVRIFHGPVMFPPPTNISRERCKLYSTKYINVLQPTRLSEWKGSHLTLKAIIDLLDKGYELNHVHGLGLGHYSTGIDADLENRIANYGDFIRIEDIPYDDMWSYIIFADIIVHPTIGVGLSGDPTPIAVQQAAMSNAKIIASNSGRIPILLENHLNTEIVPAGDFSSLLKALRCAVSEKNLPVFASEEADKTYFKPLEDSMYNGGAVYDRIFSELLLC